MSAFAANVFKLASGSALAQGITVLALPVLSRLFLPEALGVSALFLSLAGLIGVLACLRYELAIVLPGEDEEAAGLLWVSTGAAMTVSILTALGVWFGGRTFCALLHTPQLLPYLWLLPFAVLINGLFLAFSYWQTRSRGFGRLSLARVSASGLGNGTRLGCGFAGLTGPGSLIAATLLGQGLSAALLGAAIRRDHGAVMRLSLRPRLLLQGMRAHRKFPLLSSWSVLLNTASRQLPAWLLAVFFTPAAVGFFALSRMALSVPMALVGAAIRQVFYQHAASREAGGRDNAAVVREVFRRLAAIGGFPLLLLILIGEEAFTVVFGAAWSEAGVYVQVLSIGICAQFVTSPLMSLLSIHQRQGTQLLLDVFLFLSRGAGLALGGLTGNVLLGLGLYTLAGIVYYLLFHFWLHRHLGLAPFALGVEFARTLAPALPLLLLPLICKWALHLSAGLILSTGMFSAVVWYALLVSRDRALQTPVLLMLAKAGLRR